MSLTPHTKKLIIAVVGLAILTTTYRVGEYVGFREPRPSEMAVGINNKNIGQPSDVDFETFWKAWNLVNEKFVDGNGTSTGTTTGITRVAASNQDRVYGAIGGMVAALGDPYTVFFPPKEKKLFEAEIRGNFGGVGMEMGSKDGSLVVISPLKDSPARKAGVLAGDKIVKINDKLTSGLSVEDGVGLIRGEIGTSVTLTLLRDKVKEPVVLTIVRDTIKIPTSDTETIIDPKTKAKIFIIHLYNFGEDSPNAFREGLRQFVAADTDKLILDLRGNPGGYLEAAVDMASFFLPQGKVVVQEYSGDGKHDEPYRSKGYNVFTNKLKMVVLVDKGSASAAEILAGALSEYKVATLVGEQTFGKGSVQELVPLTSNTSMKITVARWLTPNGVHISHGGLTPEVKVSLDPKDIPDIKDKKKADPQIAKSIEVLLSK